MLLKNFDLLRFSSQFSIDNWQNNQTYKNWSGSYYTDKPDIYKVTVRLSTSNTVRQMLRLGKGNTPVTADDYWLAEPLIISNSSSDRDGIYESQSLVRDVSPITHRPRMILDAVFKNLRADNEDVEIKEAVVLAECTWYNASSSTSSGTTYFTLVREVFDTPIIVPYNTSKKIVLEVNA